MLSRPWQLSSRWPLFRSRQAFRDREFFSAGQSHRLDFSIAWMFGCAALGLLLPGCRGSYPMPRAVHVTHDPSVELPEFDGPPQRLATAKPRVGSEMPSRVTNAGDGVDASSQVAAVGHIDDFPIATRTVSPATTKTMQFAAESPKQPPAKSSPASNRTFVREGNTQVESIRRPSGTDSAQIQQARLPADADAMLDAFKNSPPEVQQQALRQLIAAASRTADSTHQPAGIDELLKASLAQHPELPPSGKSNSEQQPVRIAYSTEEESTPGANIVLSHRTDESHPDHSAVRTASHVSDSTYSIDKAKTGRSEMTRVSDSEVHIESIGDLVTNDSNAPVVSSIHHSSEPKSALDKSAEGKSATAKSTLSTPTTKPVSSDDVKHIADFDVASMSESELYAELLSRLSKATVDESDADRSRRLVMMRHLMVLSGRVDDAVSRIDGMAESEQEYLRHQLLGLWTIIDPDGHPVPGRRFSAALPQFREATTQLAAATDSLDVRSLAFCTEIESYGQFKKFPSTRFKAGQQVILYCEIENFVAAKVANGFETNLQGSYDVFNEAGEKVASQLLPADRQVSNNYLRDYFIAYQMYLPKNLATGKYRLQLTLEDLTGKKYGQSTIAFDVTR